MPDRVMAHATSLTSDPAAAMHPRHAVMPTVFIAGPPKSASTFLWACVHSIFRPESVCGGGSVEQWRDHDCGGRGFVLPFLEYAAWRGPGFHPEKESKGWWPLGDLTNPRVGAHTWRQFAGPRLPIRAWLGRWKSPLMHDAVRWHESIDRMCMDSGAPRCAQRFNFSNVTDPSCVATCDPCEWVPSETCSTPPFPCASRACAPFGAGSKLAHADPSYLDTHARSFAVHAVVHRAELAAARISAERVLTLEGSPGVFCVAPRSRLLAAIAPPPARARLRFVVGLRDPTELAFSYWAYLDGRRSKQTVDAHVATAVDALEACDSAADARGQPGALLGAADERWHSYFACLRRAAPKIAKVSGGLYALYLTHFLREGFAGSQFLLVASRALGDAALPAALADFLGLELPPNGTRACPAKARNVMTTSARLPAHNLTEAEVKAWFLGPSPAGARLRAYFAPHEALLPPLVKREGVRVFGATL